METEAIKTADKQVIPFSNGTEAMVWHEANCDRCDTYEDESEREADAACKLAFNIDLGFISGTVPQSVCNEIGCISTHGEHVRLNSKCSKFKPFKPS